MIRNSSFLLIIVLQLLSCNSNEHESKEKSVSVVNEVQIDSTSLNGSKNNVSELNTGESTSLNIPIHAFVLGSFSFTIYNDTIPDYISFEDTDGVYTRSKELELIQQFSNVQRINDTLEFFIESDTMRLFDVKFDQENLNYENVIDYYFQGEVDDSTYWKIFFVGHEKSGTLLMHQKTGEKLFTLHKYVQSGSKDYLLFYNEDIERRHTTNGFHLLQSTYDELVDTATREFEMWGPKSIVYDTLTDKYYIQRFFKDGYTFETDTVVMDIQPYAAETDS
jgi:hypothetical protein